MVQKSLRVLKLLRVLSDRVLFKFLSVDISSRLSVIGSFVRFSVMSVFFRYISEWVFFRFFSDSVLFESSVLGSSSGSSVMDSSLGFSVLPVCSYSFIKMCSTFFIMSKSSVLRYISKKKFILNNYFNMF